MKDDRNTKGKLYKKWKYEVFVRDNWKCQHCGSEDNLHAHHIIEWKKDEKLRYEISNGLALCNRCHARHHSLGRTTWNKGIKMSEEHRKKLSKSHLGQKAWNKGKKTNPETIEKIRKARMGQKIKPFTEEHKRKIGLANKDKLAFYSESRKGKTWIICSNTGKRIWIENKIN